MDLAGLLLYLPNWLADLCDFLYNFLFYQININIGKLGLNFTTSIMELIFFLGVPTLAIILFVRFIKG